MKIIKISTLMPVEIGPRTLNTAAEAQAFPTKIAGVSPCFPLSQPQAAEAECKNNAVFEKAGPKMGPAVLPPLGGLQ